MTVSKIFVIGGTGAQGMPVVRGLVSDGKYAVKVLTRNTKSPHAQELSAMSPKVELFEGTFTSETDLHNGLEGCDGLFLNIDGFTVGEKAEMFWTVRIYELAIQHKIKHFVFGNLDYGTKKGGYDLKYRTGHYDAKGRMAEWLLSQHRLNKTEAFYNMTLAIFTTGPYIEMAIASNSTPMAPRIEIENGEEIVTWRVPLTQEGAVVHVSLEDCAYYARWLFDNPDQDGIDLEVAIDHVQYADLAAAFERVTGAKARFIDVSLEQYWTDGSMSKAKDAASGIETDVSEPGTLTIKDNFTGFWNLWRDSGKNKGVIRRDYELLDKIHPNRIRSVEQFLRLEDERAKAKGSSLLEHVKTSKSPLKLHHGR
jgi:uncharacterized protein YbjT (DUF2867 family)